MEIITNSCHETQKFAFNLASSLKKGDTLAFKGGLGVGKTTFIGGLALGIGYKEQVFSPTFAIVNVYQCEIPLIHFDFYRLSSYDDLISCGFYDYLEQDVIMAIEWSENFKDCVPENCIVVAIENLGDDKRKIIVYGENNEDTRFRQ